MNSHNSTIVYSELFRPWFAPMTFFLPWFWKYGVIIDQETITFGYGISGAVKGGLCSHTTNLRDVDRSTVTTGYASGKDNLFQFGGWGIKYGLKNRTWAYNASFRGPFVEFAENGDKVTRYRIVTERADLIASFLADVRAESKKDI
jgi:hypothetical protein